jgi:RNA polymerase sigma-70 factor, ECF subfamily
LDSPLDSDLVEQTLKGDHDAFARLVDRHWERLYRWLYHLTHAPHDAEDLTQEAFLRAFHGLERFRPGTNFRAWLFRIAYNAFLKGRRAVRVRLSLSDNWPARDQGPEEKALSREALLLLARAVGRLPTDFRVAFLLRAEEGLSFREIGEVLGITEGTARWRIFKAREKLIGVLEAQSSREPS